MTEAEARGASDVETAAALVSAREQLAATREVLVAMSASGFDLKAVLQTIAENAVRLCRADNASVIRRDAATGYEIFASAGQFETGLDDYERYFAGRTFQPGRGSLTGRVLLARKTVQIDDMTADADYDPASAPVMRPQTLLGVPIMRGGEVEGLIIVRRHPVARFSAREIEILETFSRQAAIAMENVRLFSETKAALEQQTATAEVLKTISRSAFHLQSVFDVVVDNALSLCRGDFSYLYRRDGDVFRIVAARGGNKELLDYELANPTPITRRTLIGRVALDRQIVHIPDLFEDPEYDWPSNREQGVHTLLGVPALRDGDVVAVIGVARNERRPFSGEEIRLVEIFADQAAIAIENVRLFNETREALAQQTALSEVLNTISRSAFDLDTVLQTIVERAASLCDADGAAIHRRVGDVAIYAASYGDIGAVPGDTIPIDDGTVVGRAMLTGQRQYIPDARLQPDLPQEGPNTRLNIPFVRDGVAIGSLAVTRRVARPFSDSELRLFEVFADQAAIAIENVRLFNETKESLERQTALAEILRVIASSPSDDQPVFDTIAANATRYCGAEDALVLLVRGDGIVRVAHHGPRPIAEDPNIPLTREGVAGRAILERRTVHVADITAPEGDEYPWTRQRASVAGDRGVVATPLVRDGTAIGVIALRKLDTSGFTPSQIQLVEAFADQAVIAIENVRLFNETREALDRQSATAEVLKVMSDSPFELEPVLDSLVETAARLCNADHSAIFRREGDMLRMAATSKGRQSTLFEVFHARPLPLDRTTLTGRAVLDARTIHLPDVSADPDLVMLQERPEYLERTGGVAPDQVRRRSGLAVPLIRETEVIGAFALWRVTVSPFSTREIELIETFARQAVIAIENVRLFNETKEALERQTAISEILRAIANSPGDEKPVLATIAHSATLFCGAADAAILLIRDGQFKFAAHHGPVLLGGDSFSIPMTRESVAGHAAIELRTIQVADVLGPEGQAYPPARSGFEATGQRAILATPLIRENQAIGAIVLRKTEAGAFSTSQVALVEAFADQAVIAIENVRLFNGTKEALEQQTAVSDVLKTISRSAFDLQPVLDIVLNNAVRLAGADIGWLARVEGEQFATVSYSTEFPQSVRDELFRARAQGHISPLVPLGKAGGLMGFTLAEGRTVHLPDVRDDPDLKHSVIVRATESRTVVGVPMLREGRSIGAMVLARFEVRPFGDRELELVQTFADQAAIAIENVRLFNETKEALERQTATAQVLRAI
ncbi:MAG: GAF domain-containing protein, partial [Candidatus Limnocylindria bacterium]